MVIQSLFPGVSSLRRKVFSATYQLTSRSSATSGVHGQDMFTSKSWLHVSPAFHSKTEISSNSVFPQGIQGINDANLKVWYATCKRYGLENCDDQLQGIQSGRKTLSQVLAEQDALIEQIAKGYKEARKVSQNQNVQGIQSANNQFVFDQPCPQGVQGEDCAQFRLWLKNCHKFGITNCEDQLNSVKSGKKTLSEIFKEQDNLIHAVVIQFQQKRSYSKLYPNNIPPPTENNDENTVKLNQKERLKKAVKEYGSTVIVFHVCISLMSLGGFYLAVSSGLDVVSVLSKIGVGESFLGSKDLATAGTFVVAYAVHKVFAPVRIAITLTSVPFIVRYLRHIGFLKIPVPKSAK